MNPVARVCCFCLAVAGLSGCRTSDPDVDFARIINEPAPLSAATRAKFGVVGILPAGAISEFNFRPPKSFPKAFDYTTEKTFNQLERATRNEDESLGAEATRYAFISVLTLAAGTMNSIFNSVPEAELKRGRAAVTQVLRDDPLDVAVQTRVQTLATATRLTNVVAIPEAALAQLRAQSVTNGNYRALAGNGFDSVLLIHTSNQGFAAHENVNPLMAFCAQVDVQVVRVADGAVLHTGALIYQGRRLRFTQWVANDAKFFRDEIKTSGQTFAEAIVEQLFSSSTESSARPATP